jgi:tRNA(adenine34) deaminase
MDAQPSARHSLDSLSSGHLYFFFTKGADVPLLMPQEVFRESHDERWMLEALMAAREAETRGEVPIGAIVVAGEQILAAAGNRTRTDCDPTAHAEIIALREAARRAGNYRLTDATLYATIEPCAMCAGALVQARVARLVYGARDERFGAVESKFRLCDSSSLNHRMEIASGVLEAECRELMQEFFRARRSGLRQK